MGMSERKCNVPFSRLFVIIAAGLLILSLSPTFLPYSDEDAKRIAIRAREHDFAGESRPPEEIFRELQISPFRLSFHRSSGEMNGTWDTWRLSECFELVLFGGVHRPGKFFRAEVQYQPDRLFFVKLLLPVVGVMLAAGVILSLVRWTNRRDSRRLVNHPSQYPETARESNCPT